MANPSNKMIVRWVNDPPSRGLWGILAGLCLCGFTQLMQVFKDESQVIYKHVGMSLVALYAILLVKSFFSEAPTIAYSSGSVLRSFVALLFFFIIFFTVYYNRTLQVLILVHCILFGVVALVQLLSPVDEFYVGYVLFIIVLAVYLAFTALTYNLDVMPFWFCFYEIAICEMMIVVVNWPGNHRFFRNYF